MYTVYKIVNMINKKIYIGVHKTSNPNDNYMGSSKLVKNAIKKYGVNNFDKRILYITEHENLAYKLEKLLVTKEFINKRREKYTIFSRVYESLTLFIYQGINIMSGLGTKSDSKQKRMEASGSKQSQRSPKIHDL